MRAILLATLILLALPAQAMQIEAEASFGTGPRHLTVISTTDVAAVEQVLDDFAASHAGITLRYLQAASVEIDAAVRAAEPPADLVISSAMGLQVRLVNDGFARRLALPAPGLPDWAQWRGQLYGVGLEPVIALISRDALGDLPLPATRRELTALLREHPDRFEGRIGSYDPAVSGVGYFLLAQDARKSEGFWRLAEVMGRLNARLYCCSGDMIADLRAGKLALAYNVVASYAARTLADDPQMIRLDFADYTLAIQRTAFVPQNAPDPEGGAMLLEWLLTRPAQAGIVAMSGTPLLADEGPAPPPHLRMIPLDVGLLVDEDRARRASLLAEWSAAMTQP
ncbi:ABC transporter substrate-binding protein [Paracoccus jeotgali]|uniref:ABC transporter substrate-binding protein n=1 Tax=Paracoccus jeotgali TaxID=2065379 RepID=A0A2K9MLC8_9RHOB|nr:substrate-binding domain-containing protein [Paracoccus jeotgali]AUM75415.1 ABC transporter substrate-binding protein [Paracoccus jeotgali]